LIADTAARAVVVDRAAHSVVDRAVDRAAHSVVEMVTVAETVGIAKTVGRRRIMEFRGNGLLDVTTMSSCVVWMHWDRNYSR
jgi:hypothetical protein